MKKIFSAAIISSLILCTTACGDEPSSYYTINNIPESISSVEELTECYNMLPKNSYHVSGSVSLINRLISNDDPFDASMKSCFDVDIASDYMHGSIGINPIDSSTNDLDTEFYYCNDSGLCYIHRDNEFGNDWIQTDDNSITSVSGFARISSLNLDSSDSFIRLDKSNEEYILTTSLSNLLSNGNIENDGEETINVNGLFSGTEYENAVDGKKVEYHFDKSTLNLKAVQSDKLLYTVVNEADDSEKADLGFELNMVFDKYDSFSNDDIKPSDDICSNAKTFEQLVNAYDKVQDATKVSD